MDTTKNTRSSLIERSCREKSGPELCQDGIKERDKAPLRGGDCLPLATLEEGERGHWQPQRFYARPIPPVRWGGGGKPAGHRPPDLTVGYAKKIIKTALENPKFDRLLV